MTFLEVKNKLTEKKTFETKAFRHILMNLVLKFHVPGLYAISLPPKVVTNNLTNSGPI